MPGEHMLHNWPGQFAEFSQMQQFFADSRVSRLLDQNYCHREIMDVFSQVWETFNLKTFLTIYFVNTFTSFKWQSSSIFILVFRLKRTKQKWIIDFWRSPWYHVDPMLLHWRAQVESMMITLRSHGDPIMLAWWPQWCWPHGDHMCTPGW